MKKTPVRIRPARLQDLPAVMQFEHLLGEHERPFAPNLFRRRGSAAYYSRAKLRTMIRSSRACVLIAEVGDRAIGYTIGEHETMKAPWARYRSRGYIGAIYVHAQYRSLGVGRRLITELIRWFKKKGEPTVRLYVFTCNHRAAALYRRIGFADQLIQMEYPMPQRRSRRS